MSPRPLPLLQPPPRAPPKPAALRYTALRRTAYTPRTPDMRTKTRDAARQTRAARRSTKQPPLKRRRSRAGTAILSKRTRASATKATASSSSSEPARERGRRPQTSEAYDSNGIVYAWDKLDLDIKQYDGPEDGRLVSRT